VRVNFRLALIERDVADKRENLDLLGERNPFVIFPRAIEITQRDVAERADGGEVAAGQSLSLRKIRQPRHHFVDFVEDRRVSLRLLL
jgi:hypothetical protein